MKFTNTLHIFIAVISVILQATVCVIMYGRPSHNKVLYASERAEAFALISNQNYILLVDVDRYRFLITTHVCSPS